MGSPDAGLRPRSGWHAWRPLPGAEPPGWLVELALTVECPRLGAGARWPQALLLGRAPGPAAAVSALVVAFQEFEEVAGVRRSGRLGLVRAAALPGLEPVAPVAVAQRLDAACRRGLATPRPGRLEGGRVAAVWEAGPGAALSAWGPAGRRARLARILDEPEEPSPPLPPAHR